MTEHESSTSLMDLISEETTPEEFESVLKTLTSKVKDLTFDEINEGILYLSAFASQPATFDAPAIGGSTMLSEEKLQSFIDIAKSIGVLKDSEKDGRFFYR